MIPIMFFAFLGGLMTFAAWANEGILMALVFAPFGASAAAFIAGLTIAARNPE